MAGSDVGTGVGRTLTTTCNCGGLTRSTLTCGGVLVFGVNAYEPAPTPLKFSETITLPACKARSTGAGPLSSTETVVGSTTAAIPGLQVDVRYNDPSFRT